MNFLLGIEINDHRIAWIYNSAKSNISTIKLTTISAHQRKAEIKIYLKRNNRKYLIASETVTNIPNMAAGEPSIDIRPEIDGKTLNYSIYLNRKFIKKGSVRLNRYLRPWKAAGISALVIAAVLLIFAGLYFFNPFKVKTTEQDKGAKADIQQTDAAVEQKAESAAPAGTAATEDRAAEAEPEAAQPEPETKPPTSAAAEEEPAVEIIFEERSIADSISVYFKPDNAALTQETKDKLNSFISGLPSADDFEDGKFSLQVKGHCAKFGTEEGRAELSRERADNVHIYLKNRWGIEAESVITGAGASEPYTLDKEKQFLNRRVDVNLVGDIKIKTTKE